MRLEDDLDQAGKDWDSYSKWNIIKFNVSFCFRNILFYFILFYCHLRPDIRWRI
jgi:hypothetical protein